MYGAEGSRTGFAMAGPTRLPPRTSEAPFTASRCPSSPAKLNNDFMIEIDITEHGHLPGEVALPVLNADVKTDDEGQASEYIQSCFSSERSSHAALLAKHGPASSRPWGQCLRPVQLFSALNNWRHSKNEWPDDRFNSVQHGRSKFVVVYYSTSMLTAH